MIAASFRFYAELNDFLPKHRQAVAFAHQFAPGTSIKHAIESLGIPHTEVELILVGGQSVDFSYLLVDGDHVSVYPVFEALDVSSLVRVRQQPLRQVRFIADAHLGKLATYLRMLGYDTLYQNDFSDSQVAQLAASDSRAVLTRDRGLLKRSAVTHGYLVRSSAPRQQVVEVLRRFDLFDSTSLLRRCLRCNELLRSAGKEEVLDRLLPKTRRHYDEFSLCPTCGRVYWRGSHYERMNQFLRAILAQHSETD